MRRIRIRSGGGGGGVNYERFTVFCFVFNLFIVLFCYF